MTQLVKNLPAMKETHVWSLGWEDPLEKEIATHSSIFAWRIPWTEELGYSPCDHKDLDMTVQLTGEQKRRMHFKLLQNKLALSSTCRFTDLSTLSCPNLVAHSISFTWNSLLLLLTFLTSPTMQFSFSWFLKVKSESKVTQSCPTLCDPMDCSLSGSSVRGIFQARVLEWGAISFTRGSYWPRDRTQVSHIVGRHSPSEPPRKSLDF